MEISSSQMETVEHQFDSFCKKVLREEYRDINRAVKRIGKRCLRINKASFDNWFNAGGNES